MRTKLDKKKTNEMKLVFFQGEKRGNREEKKKVHLSHTISPPSTRAHPLTSPWCAAPNVVMEGDVWPLKEPTCRQRAYAPSTRWCMHCTRH